MVVKRKPLSGNSKTVLPVSLMLFVLWVLFTMKMNWQHLLMGAVVSVLIGFFTSLVFNRKMDANLNISLIARFPLFFMVLFWEIIKANADVLVRVFAPRMPISPRIIAFESYLETDLAKVVFANSITLTPGTVTIDIEGSRFYVHCLAAAHGEGLLEGKLERMVAWLFSEGPAEQRSLR